MLEDHGEALMDVQECGAGVLGLDSTTAESLFTPTALQHGVSMYQVTADRAVRTLRHLAKTGEVDWRATADA